MLESLPVRVSPLVEVAGKESGGLEEVWTSDLGGVEDGGDKGAIGEVEDELLASDGGREPSTS